MDIDKVVEQLLYFKSLGFKKVKMLNDGYYTDNIEICIKKVNNVDQEVTDSIVKMFENHIPEQNIRLQYDTYGSDLSFEDYLAKAVSKRDWQKANWAEGKDTLVIEPKE